MENNGRRFKNVISSCINIYQYNASFSWVVKIMFRTHNILKKIEEKIVKNKDVFISLNIFAKSNNFFLMYIIRKLIKN